MDGIAEWLGRHGLEQYTNTFEENDIDTDVLPDLTDDDLKELGLSLGHRKRFLKAANAAISQSPADSAPQAPSPEAERRQLTVMFVDLVGSTALSNQLDPEDMRGVITSYQNSVAGVVTRFEGHVAKYMGDGVLCYFGWPHAHEDDAERAVRAGRAIMQSIAVMTSPTGETLSARAGVATGLVVVGDLIGDGAAQENAVVGDTPNLAARIQDLAEPGQVAIAAGTRSLLGDMFELDDLGSHSLKGFDEKTSAFAVVGERAAESRFEARSAGNVTQMVGRDHELALMQERWRRAQAMEGQLILLTGEAGIGKSRITRAMIDSVASEEHIRLNYQCSPYHSDSSLYPAIQHLLQAAAIKLIDSNDDKLDKIEAIVGHEVAPLIAAMMDFDGVARYGPIELEPQQQRARTLQALVEQLIQLSERQPVLMVFEDAHWIDATSLELLDLCLDQVATSRVLMLITARPTFEHGFGGHPIVTRLTLNRLGRDQVASIVGKLTGGKALPTELLQEIGARTDGVPLFVEELTKTLLESGDLTETETAFELTGPISHLAIPSTLHDSLMARLDRLQPIKEIAQTASCIGREFDHKLLSAISPLDDQALVTALEKLASAELIYRRGVAPEATYIFKHALVRDAAYESLLKSRRLVVHAKLVDALEDTGSAAPELIAHHSTEAGLSEKAVHYWQIAGDSALARPAYDEAISHLNAAIQMLGQLPARKDWQERELELQVQLAQVLLTRRGYGSESAAKAFSRAADLMDATGEAALLVPVSYGRWIGHYMRAEHEAGSALGEKLCAEVDKRDDLVARLVAHRLLAASQIALGRQQEANDNLNISLSLFSPELTVNFADRFAQEPGVQIKAYLVFNLWLLGYPDQAAEHALASRKAAAELDHINTTCYGAWHWSIMWELARDFEQADECNAIAYELGTQHQLLTWQHYAGAGDALTRSRNGIPDGMQLLDERMADYSSRGQWLMVPYFRTIQANELMRLGRLEDARSAIHSAFDVLRRTNETWTQSELHRLEGEIDFTQGDKSGARDNFTKAIGVAQQQGAKSWELRATMSLARFLADQGERAKAFEALQPVYEWFTEGFNTADLCEARELLAALR